MEEENSSPPESAENKKEKKLNKIILIVVLILLLLLISAGLVYYFIFYEKDNSDNSDKNGGATEAEQKKETKKVDLSQYDGKILKITSQGGNLEGSGYIVYDEENDKLKLEYQAVLNADLPINGTCGGSVDGKNGCDDMIRHEYAQQTISQKYPERTYKNFLFPILCNKDRKLNHDEYKDFINIYSSSACDIDNHVQEKTSTFLVRGKYMEFESYEEMLGMFDVIVYDASQYWVETTDPNKEYEVEGTREFQLESENSILPENEVERYVIEIKE